MTLEDEALIEIIEKIETEDRYFTLVDFCNYAPDYWFAEEADPIKGIRYSMICSDDKNNVVEDRYSVTGERIK